MDNIIRSIYRGYDITMQEDKQWRVYEPVTAKLIAICNTETEAHKCVDVTKAKGRK